MKFKPLLAILLALGLCLALTLSLSRIQAQADGIRDDVGTIHPQAQNVELVGQIGGPTGAVVVQGSYAYISVGPRLVVLDVSDPTSPVVVGQSAVLSNIVQDVYVTGSYAYLGTGEGGLYVIDISNLAAPVKVGTAAVSTGSVYVAGSYAYLGWGECRGLGGGLWECDGSLRVVDVSNPAAPVEVGSYDAPGGVNGVYVVGNYAYVVTQNYHSSKLVVVDVSDPAVPRKVGDSLTSLSYVGDVYVAGHYAYVSTGGYAGLYVVDVSDPTAPMWVGHVSVPAEDIYVAGRYAYVTAGHDGLRVMDISDPTVPREVGVYNTAGMAAGIHVAGPYAYVADGYHGGLWVVDVSDPTAPVGVGTYHTLRTTLDVHVAGSYAYLTDGYAGLQVVDVSYPPAPVEVGAFDTPGDAQAVYVAGRYAYVTAKKEWVDGHFVGAGLRVVDVSHPAAPVEVGAFDTPGDAQAVYVAGGYAYVADESAGLRVVDISDPAAPVEVGVYEMLESPEAVYVAGRYAYVGFSIYDFPGGWSGGLQVIDILNPAAPVRVGTYAIPGVASDVYVADPYVYVAAGLAGLWVIDVSNPTRPIEVGFYDTPGYAQGIYVADAPSADSGRDLAYVADGSGGLFILKLPSPVSASIPTAGGRLTSPFDQTTYTFAAGTFTDTVTITHTLRLSGQVPSTGHSSTDSGRRLAGIDHFFEVSAVYSSTGQPAQPIQPYTVTVQYTEVEKGPAIEDTLALYSWNGAQWVSEPSSRLDTDNDTITATPDHFGLWAVLGETRRMWLPLVLNGGSP
jgi:hypothetical protein